MSAPPPSALSPRAAEGEPSGDVPSRAPLRPHARGPARRCPARHLWGSAGPGSPRCSYWAARCTQGRTQFPPPLGGCGGGRALWRGGGFGPRRWPTGCTMCVWGGAPLCVWRRPCTRGLGLIWVRAATPHHLALTHRTHTSSSLQTFRPYASPKQYCLANGSTRETILWCFWWFCAAQKRGRKPRKLYVGLPVNHRGSRRQHNPTRPILTALHHLATLDGAPGRAMRVQSTEWCTAEARTLHLGVTNGSPENADKLKGAP